MFSKFSPFYTTVINVVFWTVSLVPALLTIWEVQDKKTAIETQEFSSDGLAGEADRAQKQDPSEKVQSA